MQKICRQCNVDFEVTDNDLFFYAKISPIFHGKKYVIPPPTLCPDCRQQRRLVGRNERSFYSRSCHLCGKEMISVYAPQSDFTVYCRNCWSDRSKWDALIYGMVFDFSKTFFEHINLLLKKVPYRTNNVHLDSENSDYCNNVWHIKNCYLSINVGYSEDCLYCQECYFSKNLLDCFDVKNSELCAYCYNCNNCYHCFFAENCSQASDVLFSLDCKGCNDVFLCWGLRKKQYCIFNQQYPKEEYFKKIKEINTGQYSLLLQYIHKFQEMKKKAIYKENNNIKTENCSGDYLLECKNCYACFNLYKAEDCKYIFNLDNDGKDSHDINYCAEIELCYEGLAVAGYNSLFCVTNAYGTNNIYCQFCEHCKDCFGCVGVQHHQYCILNKQYTKEEYEELVPKIIEYMMKTGEWGEFFPPSLSPFGYNETVANEYYPLTREQALGISDASNTVGNRHAYSLQHGQIFNWSDYESSKPDVKKIIPASKLPDDITKIPDDILNWAIECEVTKKPFRIIKQELEFYRQHNLPIPRRHPDQRHKDRLALRNPRKLFQRNCMNCNKEIQTTYAPPRKEMVYCEKCYLDTVY